MPEKAAEESAAYPPGPVTWAESPGGASPAICRSWSVVAEMVSQPPDPTGTTTCRACPSLEGTGPTTPAVTPVTALNRPSWAVTAAVSAPLRPDGRS